jgi:PH domain
MVQAKKRPGGGVDIPDPSSSDNYDESLMVESDDDGRGTAMSPKLDESMILSDEEDDHRASSFVDDVEGQAKLYVNDDEEGNVTTHKTATNKRWGSKKNHAHPVNAASAALMVEDKPWRSRSATAAPAHATKADVSTPKSPNRISQLVMSSGNKIPTPPHINNQANAGTSTVDAMRPILKYIRGFGAAGPISPRRQWQIGGGAPPTPGNWSDNEENDGDHSSIRSEMISYSSIDSMDDSDDDWAMPLEDYTQHPENQPGFWTSLPYVPSHFVHENAESGQPLPYLEPDFKTLIQNDPSLIETLHFVLDHKFYLRALFQLLAERDAVGVEDSILDNENIIKKGPLRKKYLGKANYKYVELRKGNLVYFGDDDGEGRKTIHLRSATASCKAADDSPTDAGKDGVGSSHSPPGTHSSSGTGGGPPSMHQAAASLSAGLTTAVNATTSAASTITGGPSATAGFEFHLWVEGKRYAWLANSNGERQSWVKAIRSAMIGEVNDDDWGMSLNTALSPNLAADDLRATYKEALESYQKLQSHLQKATTLHGYLESILALAPHPDSASTTPALQIPLKCLSEHMPTKDGGDTKKATPSQRRRVKQEIKEFWDMLIQYDFAINGHVIDRQSPCAAERIIGSIVRCILDYDHSFAESGTAGMPSVTEAGATDKPTKRSDTHRISELDAVSYARSILLLMIKSKTSGDVEFAVDNLLKNEGLVRVEGIDGPPGLSTASDALHIDVSFAGDDIVDHNDDGELSNEASGWVMVRRSKYNTWKSRFCVFAEGVFSYYENAHPRPHGLRGQLLLSGATLSEVDDEKDRVREDAGLYILRLTMNGQERERQFAFESEDDFLEWKEVIQHAIDGCDVNPSTRKVNDDGTDPDGARESTGHKKTMSMTIIGGGTKLISYATDESIKAIKGATDSSMKVVKGGTKAIMDATGALKGATNLMFRSIRSSRARSKRGANNKRPIRKTPSLQFLMERTRTAKTGKREPTVQCVVQTTSEFRICPNPEGESADGESTLV